VTAHSAPGGHLGKRLLVGLNHPVAAHVGRKEHRKNVAHDSPAADSIDSGEPSDV
jgi:hypothetical protein